MRLNHDRFLDHYPVDQIVTPAEATVPDDTPGEIVEFLRASAGASFGGGVYRLHGRETKQDATDAVSLAFPSYAEHVDLFGYDWLGRHFARPLSDPAGAEDRILLFEFGVGEVFDIPGDFFNFHNVVLVDEAEATLAVSFYHEWADANEGFMPLRRELCVGYRTPLFLGGADNVDNLELIDCSVYWHLTAQLIERFVASSG